MDGSPATQIISLIKQHGANTDTLIEFATVTAASPLSVKVDGMKIELDAGDLVIPEHLTSYTRQVTINGGQASTMVVDGALKAGDRIIIAQIKSGQTFVIIDRIGADV